MKLLSAEFHKGLKYGKKAALAVLLTGPLVVLGGCGFAGIDGVEVNLPFVGNVLSTKARQEVRMKKRGPLVMPPSNNQAQLPAPEARTTQANANLSWPKDPDKDAKTKAEIEVQKRKKYAKDGNIKTYDGVEEFEKNLDWSARQQGLFKKYGKK